MDDIEYTFSGREEAWNYLLGFYAMLILISGMALPWLPESPKYLYTVKGLRQKAIRGIIVVYLSPGYIIYAIDCKCNYLMYGRTIKTT